MCCLLQVLEFTYNTSLDEMESYIEMYMAEQNQPFAQGPGPVQLQIPVPIPVPVPSPVRVVAMEPVAEVAQQPQQTYDNVLIEYMRGFDQVLGQREMIVPLDPRLRNV